MEQYPQIEQSQSMIDLNTLDIKRSTQRFKTADKILFNLNFPLFPLFRVIFPRVEVRVFALLMVCWTNPIQKHYLIRIKSLLKRILYNVISLDFTV